MKVLVALVALTAIATAADLAAEFTPLISPARPAAPEWVEVKLTARGTGVREGALEFALHADGVLLYRYRTHDLALTAGAQSFRFLLPAASLAYPPVVRKWRLHFVEKERTIDLGEFSSTPRPISGRTLVLGVVRGSATRESPTWRAWRLERFAPSADDSSTQPTFSTTPAFLDADDLPTDPLGYCAFDAVLLEGDALARTREKTRNALARWVNAGGSLAVVAPTGIDDVHVSFLNQLAAPDPRHREFARPLTGLMTARPNFGRLVVAAEPPPDELPADWRQAAGFLWKLRAAPLRSLASSPQWAEAADDPRQLRRGDFRSGSSLSDPLVEMLMPSDIRPLPAPVLWAIVLGFIVAVGPLDWWLLGKLRQRRLTWIVFPCVAVGFTLLTVGLARGYLGGVQRTSEMLITDLGTDGRVVRETRIGLVLPAVGGELSFPVEAALSVPIPTRTRHENFLDAQFTGQFPARHRLVLPGRQWSPVLTRTTSLAGGEDTSGVAWREPPKTLPGNFAADLRGNSGAVLDIFSHGKQRWPDSGILDFDWRKDLVITPRRGAFTSLAAIAPTGSPFFEDLACLDYDSTDTSVILAITHEGTTWHIWRRLFLH